VAVAVGGVGCDAAAADGVVTAAGGAKLSTSVGVAVDADGADIGCGGMWWYLEN
jgi:hypothetical protein